MFYSDSQAELINTVLGSFIFAVAVVALVSEIVG